MFCPLYQYVPGTLVENNRQGIKELPFFIGEAPGAEEVNQGAPFVGRSGQLLRALLKDIPTYYLTNTIKCRPPGNRNPTTDEITLCRRHLNKELQELEPGYVIAVGRVAEQALKAAAEALDQPLLANRGVLVKVDHVLDYAPPHGLMIAHIHHPAAALYNANLLPVLQQEVEQLTALIR
jgi:DNA polymerase